MKNMIKLCDWTSFESFKCEGKVYKKLFCDATSSNSAAFPGLPAQEEFGVVLALQVALYKI